MPTGFLENFVLRPYLFDHGIYEEKLQQFFTSYYHSLNGGTPREYLQRSLSRPSLQEIRDFRAHLDEEVDQLLESDVDSQVDACGILRGINANSVISACFGEYEASVFLKASPTDVRRTVASG
ncbi:hypothetical protein ACPOL_6060 [Acidisarcina polymorpha]|uniref:Uncharacterized protein n=2 Tax=Acidisarcina polymorpha TaxID=2211140 RepID=A0A2Z5G9D6_9BACT|nr:hypothetical protein ACPOL_6060 [Acidisarcina polymorpha]